MNAPDPHALLAPYTLDALDDLERRRFEHHLAGCEGCAEELRGLRETTAMLGVAASVRPPAALRDRVMDEIARTRQLPPGSGRPRSPRRWFPGPALLFTAAAAVIAIALFAGFSLLGGGSGPRHPDPKLDAVLAASDARSVDVSLAGGGTGTLVVSRSQNRAAIAMSGLPDVPAGHTYELWLLGAGDPRPAGLMRETRGSRLIPSLDGATHLGVTVERAEGSPAPSGAPIFTLRLPA